MYATHLVRRFFGSLRPGGPSASEVTWVHAHLLPEEARLWSAMPGPDRRHSAAVARRVEAILGPTAERPVLAAALLHDVGKTGGLRTPGRTAVTLAAMVVGRDRLAAHGGRAGRYLRHDVTGAELLQRSGSDPVTVAWARDHHRNPKDWTIPLEIGEVLKAADDD